jgi:hypothetical protein
VFVESLERGGGTRGSLEWCRVGWGGTYAQDPAVPLMLIFIFIIIIIARPPHLIIILLLDISAPLFPLLLLSRGRCGVCCRSAISPQGGFLVPLPPLLRVRVDLHLVQVVVIIVIIIVRSRPGGVCKWGRGGSGGERGDKRLR